MAKYIGEPFLKTELKKLITKRLTTTTNTRFVHTSVHPRLNQYWAIAKNSHSERASIVNISNEIPLEVLLG